MAKVACVLYDDPIDGHPQANARDDLPERELADADVVVPQPFWPAYLTAERTAERITKAPELKLALTAGIDSDHVDLRAVIDKRFKHADPDEER